jgi:hypothetical protein
MSKDTLNALFTKESLASLQGAAAATLLVPNVLTYLIGNSFQPYEKWVALVVALLLSAIVAIQVPTKGWVKWIVAILNGFLIFASAVGLTNVLGSATEAGMRLGGKLPFFHDWYP